jgi:hypothetical protein
VQVRAVFVEAAVHLGILRQRAREHPYGVMATVAVPRELDALGAQQDVDAGSIERRAKRVRMQRLAPLTIGLLMAAPAIGSRQECARLDEIVALHRGVARRGNLAAAEVEIIGRADLVGIALALGCLILLRRACGSAQRYTPPRKRQPVQTRPLARTWGTPTVHNGLSHQYTRRR